MERLITVRSTGNVSVKPDLITININLVSHRYDYDETMNLASKSVEILGKHLEEVGIHRKELKTTSFNIKTSYDDYYDEDNHYKTEFDGYECNQDLKLEFDLDMEKLLKVLGAIASSGVNPKFNIRFSVKDKNAVNDEILISATENARRKAEILAKASNEELGEIVRIDYNFDEIEVYSNTKYEIQEKVCDMDALNMPAMEPDDIKVSDTVTFVWRIKR